MSATTASASAPAAPGRPWATAVIVWALLLTVPIWLPMVGGYTALAGRVLVLGLAAMSFNILLGFTGVMSFGHAAYFGLGAYGAGLTLKYLAASTPLAMLAGVLLGGLAGTLFGPLIVKRRGVYFAMVTVAFGQIAFYIAYSWNDLTGGYDGLRGFSRAPLHLGFTTIDIANGDNAFYYFLLVVFAVATGLQGLLLASPFGRTLLAIRENERRARFLGIPIERHIWMSFSISCAFTALAGALYALLNNFADPMGLHYSLSGEIVIMTVMGGMRAFWGPLVGAALFVVLQDYISSMTVNWMSFVGLIFVLVVLFFPRGILGMFQRGERQMIMLDVRDVTKKFGSLVAVDGVSMQVAAGELRAIIGPNGAGKTTFFNMISGFFAPTAGEIVFDGSPVTKLAVTERVALGMARTFQITEIFPELTVRENVRIGVESAMGFRSRFWLGARHAADVNRGIDEALAQTGLTAQTDRLVGELSHGDQRAAEIAMALTLKPRLLLLDEPTAGMGEHETYAVAHLIRRLHKNSAYTIVLIEHDMRVVFNLADKITVLGEGKMLAEGTPAEIAENPIVQEAYLGKAE